MLKNAFIKVLFIFSFSTQRYLNISRSHRFVTSTQLPFCSKRVVGRSQTPAFPTWAGVLPRLTQWLFSKAAMIKTHTFPVANSNFDSITVSHSNQEKNVIC